MHHGSDVHFGQHDRIFDEGDRKRVQRVCEGLLDELSDSRSVEAMFAPYAELIMQMLHDDRITQNINDADAMNDMPVCKTCKCVEDVPWHKVDILPAEGDYHEFESNKV